MILYTLHAVYSLYVYDSFHILLSFLQTINVKFTLEQAMKVQRDSRNIAPNFSLTSMGVGGQRYAPAALPPGKTRYPLYRRVGGSQDRSGRVRKISPPLGFDPLTCV